MEAFSDQTHKMKCPQKILDVLITKPFWAFERVSKMFWHKMDVNCATYHHNFFHVKIYCQKLSACRENDTKTSLYGGKQHNGLLLWAFIVNANQLPVDQIWKEGLRLDFHLKLTQPTTWVFYEVLSRLLTNLPFPAASPFRRRKKWSITHYKIVKKNPSWKLNDLTRPNSWIQANLSWPWPQSCERGGTNQHWHDSGSPPSWTLYAWLSD